MDAVDVRWSRGRGDGDSGCRGERPAADCAAGDEPRDTQPGIQARLAPLYRALAEAAAVEPELASVWEELEEGRLQGMARFAEHLDETGTLRAGVTVSEARDVLWTISSHGVYRMLVTDRGWSPTRYRDSLAATLACALLRS